MSLLFTLLLSMTWAEDVRDVQVKGNENSHKPVLNQPTFARPKSEGIECGAIPSAHLLKGDLVLSSVSCEQIRKGQYREILIRRDGKELLLKRP